jgi:hypothetical protein
MMPLPSKANYSHVRRCQLLVFGFLLLSTLHAQSQQPNMAKLKTDAQKVVNVIGSDGAKTQA